MNQIVGGVVARLAGDDADGAAAFCLVAPCSEADRAGPAADRAHQQRLVFVDRQTYMAISGASANQSALVNAVALQPTCTREEPALVVFQVE